MTRGGQLVAAESPLWRQTLDSLPHDFHHLPAYNELEADRLGGEAVALVYEQEGQRFLQPLILRSIAGTDRFDAISAYGYPGALTSDGGGAQGIDFRRQAVDALTSALQARGCVSMFVRLHPLLSPVEGLGADDELIPHGETVFVDLSLSEKEMWHQVRRDHRTQIHRARRRGLTASIDPQWRQLDDFLEVYRQSMVRVKADASYFFPRAYFEGLRDALAGSMVLCSVSDGERTLCAGLFSHVGEIVQFHLSGTGDDSVRERPSKLMLDAVRIWAHAQGARRFHLGGGFGSTADSLFEFKAGFSRCRARFYTWRKILDPAAYTRLAGERGFGPTSSEEYFPLYRAPRPEAEGTGG